MKELNKVATVAEYTCYDLMHIFHDTQITVIKINDLAQPDKQEDKTAIKLFYHQGFLFFPSSQDNCCIQ